MLIATSPILITGAAGFIGSHLCDRLLAQGATIIALDNFSDFYSRTLKQRNIETALATGRCTLIEADIRDRDAVMRIFAEHTPGVVVHLAALAGVRPSIENPAAYAAVNVDGTVNLLDATIAHRGGPMPFVFASSSSVYGNNEKVPFAEEDRVDHPISPYAATKKAGELICHTYHHLHQLPIACLRFFTVFGPRQRPDLAISKFLHLMRDGKAIPMFGDGQTSRDYTYIDDIATGILSVLSKLHHETLYRVYNLGGSSPVSLSEMIATLQRVTGLTAKLDRQPMRQGDVNRTWADLSRSEAELNYRPATLFEEGVARQWAWMQSLS